MPQGRLGKELAEFCSISSHFLGKDLAPAAATLQHMEQTCCCPLEVAEGVEDSMHLLVEAAALPSDRCTPHAYSNQRMSCIRMKAGHIYRSWCQ